MKGYLWWAVIIGSWAVVSPLARLLLVLLLAIGVLIVICTVLAWIVDKFIP